MDTVRFYFSFRSPYAWLAYHVAPPMLQALPIELEYIPVFPPQQFPNDPMAVPNKLEYMVKHDLPRLCEAYGLTGAPVVGGDIEWMPPHAMWMYAKAHGKHEAFGKAVYAARFSESKDLADAAVMRQAAQRAGLDAEATLAAGADEAHQTAVVQGMIRGVQEDAIFGVPLFVYRGERFWGHDRLPWLVRRIQVANDLPQDPVSFL